MISGASSTFSPKSELRMVESQESQHGEGNTQGASPAIPRAPQRMQTHAG